MTLAHRAGLPIIGVTPDISPESSRRGGDCSLLLSQQYTRAVLECGGIPVILPVTPSAARLRGMLDRVDGLLVTGGDFDIHPKYYGEKPGAHLGIIKEARTEFELELISRALRRDQPVLGVCGGGQAINVAAGGSLHQDIPSELPDALEHRQSAFKEIGGHGIAIRPGTRLARVTGKASLEVNSTHHQAVKRPGQGLIVSATAGDGVVECIESTDHTFVLGVQWHPESLLRRTAHKQLYAAFVKACKERAVISSSQNPDRLPQRETVKFFKT